MAAKLAKVRSWRGILENPTLELVMDDGKPALYGLGRDGNWVTWVIPPGVVRRAHELGLSLKRRCVPR